MNERPVLSVAELAAELGVSRNAIYERIRQNEIPTITVGRALRIPRRWLNEQIDAACEAVAS